MSKKANPTFIGAFVLFGLAVTIAAIMALGKFSLKDDTVHCVAYFSGSMYGLDVGAPVAFRGVVIGRVNAIRLDYDEKSGLLTIPVYMGLTQPLAPKNSPRVSAQNMRKNIESLIERGLIAQMHASSLLTGKQYIELSLKPEAGSTLHGAPADFLEIPTQASGLDKITETLERLPLEETLKKVARSLDTLNDAISSAKAGNTMVNLTNSAQQLSELLTLLNAKLPALLDDIDQGAGDFSRAMHEAKNLLASTRKDLAPASADLKKILANVRESSEKLRGSLNNLERMTAGDSDLNYQLRASLHEVERAAGAINELAGYLRQNPNALLFGSGGSDSDKTKR